MPDSWFTLFYCPTCTLVTVQGLVALFASWRGVSVHYQCYGCDSMNAVPLALSEEY